MSEEEKDKLQLLEKLTEELGERKSITVDEVKSLVSSLDDEVDLDEVIDYLTAAGVTVTGRSGKISSDSPVGMYFQDIGEVEILGKEREIALARQMRENLRQLQKLIPYTTLSIKKFLLLGVELEQGNISVDDFTVSSFRPEDITPTEHRNEIILAMRRIQKLYNKIQSLIRASKKASIGVRTYWDRKLHILKQLQEEITQINPSLKVIERILPIFFRLDKFWKETRKKFEDFLILAGITEEQAEKLYRADEKTRKKLAREWGIGEVTLGKIVKEYRSYHRVYGRIRDISLVPPEELFEKIAEIDKLVKQYEAARERLVKSNVRLVVNIARNYMNQGVDFLDLIQEGNHALLKAVERFDPDKGFKLATYAIWWVRQAMMRCIAEQSQAIKLPTYIVQWARKYSRVYHELAQKLGREPTNAEISEELGVDPEEVDDILQALQTQISLDKKIGNDEDSRTLSEVIGDTSAVSPSFAATLAVLQQEIQKLLSTLTPREAKVISLRFGLEDNYPRTLEEIGKMFGLSRERIRQIEARALAKLRHPSKIKMLEVFLKEE
ncbi:sigma-70 family RNA polymerase sigma factor [bacterium]|nr:sigma-70 family RNA polymerase sigma factor [bacterium]